MLGNSTPKRKLTTAKREKGENCPIVHYCICGGKCVRKFPCWEKPFSNCHVAQRGCEAEPVDGEPCKQTVVFVEAANNVGNLWQLWYQLWQLVTAADN